MTDAFPLQKLIEKRMAELDLYWSDLSRACGFKNNIGHGARQIDSVGHGNLNGPWSKKILDALPVALSIDQAMFDEAIKETAKIVAREEEEAEAARIEAWSAAFKPNAFLIGSSSRPSQIVIFGITGGASRWLEIPLDLSLPPITFAAQAHAVVKKTPFVPFFGATVGSIVNFSPDHAVRFALEGNPVESFARAYAPGQVSLLLQGRPIAAEAFAKIVGTQGA